MTDAATRATIGTGLVIALTAAQTLTPYTVDGFLPAFPEASAELGAAPSTMQLSITAFLVGIAAGQLIFGPLSDRLGRRTPMIIGASVCAAAAIACALAPTVTLFIVARFVQGLAGSAGLVIGKAIVRDRTSGVDTIRTLSTITVSSGVLIIFAPTIGGLLAQHLGWRGPLWFIAAVSIAVLVTIILVVPETHAVELRAAARWFGLHGMVQHLHNRPFMLYAVIQATSYGALISYVASSPFVYQRVLGFDAVTYGLLFSLNALAVVTVNFIGNRVLRGVGSKRLIMFGFVASFTGAILTAALWSLDAPPWVVAIAITCAMAPLGLNGPNLIGLALNRVATAAGSAAGAIGFLQFLSGSAVSPVVGLWGADTLLPMTACMVVLTTVGGSSLLVGHFAERRAVAARAATTSVPTANLPRDGG